MRVLLDTHVLLWMIGESQSLSDSALRVLADETNELFFSSISSAEVAIKHQKNAVLMPLSPDDVRFAAKECGVQELEFDSGHAVALGTLPLLHRDPFDRMLIAQAKAEGMKIVSHDCQFPNTAISSLPCDTTVIRDSPISTAAKPLLNHNPRR